MTGAGSPITSRASLVSSEGPKATSVKRLGALRDGEDDRLHVVGRTGARNVLAVSFDADSVGKGGQEADRRLRRRSGGGHTKSRE